MRRCHLCMGLKKGILAEAVQKMKIKKKARLLCSMFIYLLNGHHGRQLGPIFFNYTFTWWQWPPFQYLKKWGTNLKNSITVDKNQASNMLRADSKFLHYHFYNFLKNWNWNIIYQFTTFLTAFYFNILLITR